MKALPEPFTPPRSRETTPPNHDRINFLLFGTISHRKGLIEIFDALTELEPRVASRVRLVVAGRFQGDLRQKADRRVQSLVDNQFDIEVRFEDRFIADDELIDLVVGSDVVLATYREHVGSSGILVWAAYFGRPVISQSYGLMGILVRRYRLGLVCDPQDKQALATCIRQAILEGPETLGDDEGMAEYAAANNDNHFINAVFDALGLLSDGPKNELSSP